MLNVNKLSIQFIILTMSLALLAGIGYGKSSAFDWQLQLQTVYDDNIINYSDPDLDQFDDPSAQNDKFAIESKDDFIINPEIELIYKTQLLGHSFHVGLITDYYYFSKNDIKRHWRFETYFKRYFKRGSYFQASVVYLPDYYYRNCFISGEGFFESEFDKILTNAKFAYRFNKKIQANLEYSFSNKDFIEIFDERDITEHQFGGSFIYRPVSLWKGWLSYEYCHAVGAGADNITYRRDTSYDHNKFTVGSRFYLKGLTRKSFQIAASASYKFVQYQTTKISDEDRYRLGREDKRFYLNFSIKHYIKRGINAEARYKYYLKNVDIPAKDLEDKLESSSNTLYFILNYSL